MTKRFMIMSLLSLASSSFVSAEVINIVSPAGMEDSEGNGVIPGGFPPLRTQDFYSASDFQELPDGGAWLIATAERADGNRRREGTVRFDDVSLTLGTTKNDHLDREYAQNLGSDPQTVFHGAHELQYDVSNENPNPFSAVWEFDTPYLYDPTEGNLVVEIINQNHATGAVNLDSHSVPRISSVGGPPGLGNATASFRFSFIQQFTFVPVGDVTFDGTLDSSDVDELTPGRFDLDGDGDINDSDRAFWVHEIIGTWFGDANLDDEFNSSDLIAVFQSGHYELETHAGWAEGDWNGDHRFGSADLIAAFQDGGYEQGPRTAVNAVPELASGWLLGLGLMGVICSRRKR